jgi:hypothetical protein
MPPRTAVSAYKDVDMRFVMRRFLFIITALLMVSAADLGIWSALHPPASFMIVPGAMQIEVVQASTWERVMSYQVPGPAYAWREIVARDLVAQGWEPPAWWAPYVTGIPSYIRISSFWFGAILDRADVDGAPNTARISVRRWVKLPCLLLGPSSDQRWHVGWWLQPCNAIQSFRKPFTPFFHTLLMMPSIREWRGGDN